MGMDESTASAPDAACIDDSAQLSLSQEQRGGPSRSHSGKINASSVIISITKRSRQLDNEPGGSMAPAWSWATFFKNAGPGLLMMTAFIDPGDLSNDLEVGASYQFILLWIYFWSAVVGVILQMLAAKLALVTRRSLAENCQDYYPWFANVFLWLLMEAALVAVEIQYLVGAAVGLSLLCGNNGNNVPLWASVIMCSVLAWLILLVEAYTFRLVEGLFLLLISIMCISFAVLAGLAKADGTQVIRGMAVPQLPDDPTVYLLAGGIIGGCISPYNFFLYSALQVNSRLPTATRGEIMAVYKYVTLETIIVIAFSLFMNICLVCTFASAFYAPDSTDYAAPSTDLSTALAPLAPPPAAPYYYTNYDYMENNPSLNNVGILLGITWGTAFLYIWALGLLATGLSSSSGSVYAGQVILEGFVNLDGWRKSKGSWFSKVRCFFTSGIEDPDQHWMDSASAGMGGEPFVDQLAFKLEHERAAAEEAAAAAEKGVLDPGSGHTGPLQPKELLSPLPGLAEEPLEGVTLQVDPEAANAPAQLSDNRKTAWKRAMVSRTIALIPGLVVAATYTSPTQILFLNLWLNLLQTLALPFAMLPLVHFTCSKRVMGRYWRNNVVLAVFSFAVTAFAILVACYCTIESTPFPTTDWGVGCAWFGWALYLLVALYFAIGPDNVVVWWWRYEVLGRPRLSWAVLVKLFCG